jgi:hypothetical protein
VLRGKKLRGEFHLIRMQGKNNQWLVIKANDAVASRLGTDASRGDVDGV